MTRNLAHAPPGARVPEARKEPASKCGLSEESVHVRLMREADLDLVLAWRNNSEVRRFMLSQQEIQPGEHQDWFRRACNDPSTRLLIGEEGLQPLGFVQFKEITRSGVANWGFYAAPSSKRGTGRKLCGAALMFAFDTLKLHKVCGQALDFNEGSIRIHRALGFTHEGRLREQHQMEGRFHDLLCFGLLQDEWRATRRTDP